MALHAGVGIGVRSNLRRVPDQYVTAEYAVVKFGSKFLKNRHLSPGNTENMIPLFNRLHLDLARQSFQFELNIYWYEHS